MDAVSPSVRKAIGRRLDAVEREQNVHVLYACESGSRAWGFASTNSDYDVRFVYVRPHDWYLSVDLERRDDTIDVPIGPGDDLDLHGWDLRKALHLLRKSNPTLLEWLQSPIVYRADAAVMDRLRSLVPDYYTPRAAGYAYRGLARSVAKQNLGGDVVRHKTYLYVLRAVLAVRWVERRATPPPVEFARLVDAGVDDDVLRDAIDALLARKQRGDELDAGPRLPTIHAFLDRELDRIEDLTFSDADDAERPLAPLNAFFRDVVVPNGNKDSN